LELTQGDWLILNSMLKLFAIFVRPSKKLQGERYPTMNYAIPQYLRLLHKLELLRTHFGANTTLGQACTSAYTKLDEYYKMIKKQNFAVVATVCDPRFNFNVFHNFYKDSPNANTHKIRIQKQFIETFVKYQHRERALKAVAVAVEGDTDEVAIQLDLDSEADLFQPQGVLNSEAEYTKWMKQQPIAQETNILK
jgi:exonuclease III